MSAPPSTSAGPPPRSKPAARRRRAAPAQRRRRRTTAFGGQVEHDLSPDGRWWWDGRQWQPVQQAPAGTGRSGGGRWLIAAVIVAGVAVAVPLAIAAGAFAYRVTNAPVARAGSAPVRYLADASSRRIEAAAVSRGLRCATPPQSVGGTAPVRICQRAPGVGAASGVGAATVAMVGNDSGHLVAVSGVSGEPADEPTALAFLQAIIDATVARRDAGADDAWLSAHFDQSGDSQTVVNGVSLRLTVHDPVRSLVIVPAY
jgi:hypothetical protein